MLKTCAKFVVWGFYPFVYLAFSDSLYIMVAVGSLVGDASNILPIVTIGISG